MTQGESSQSPHIGVTVLPSSDQRVSPGDTAVYSIGVENRSDEARSLAVTVDGLPQGWYRIEFDDRISFPWDQRTATLVVSVPPTTPPGQHGFRVLVTAHDEESAVACSLRVEAPAGVPASDARAPAPAPAEAGAPGRVPPPAEVSETAPPPAVELPPAAGPPGPEPVAPPAVAPPPLELGAQETEALPPAPGVALEPTQVTWEGEPGEQVRLTITVRNAGKSETEYTVSLEGLNPGWYTLPPKLRVGRGESLDATMGIHPPSRARSGDYPFTVRVAVDEHPEIAAEVRGNLTVPVAVPADRRRREGGARPVDAVVGPPAAGLQALPPDVSLSPRTTFRFGPGEVFAQAVLTIRNRSTLIDHFQIDIEGLPEGWYWLPPEPVKLEAGASQQVQMRLSPKPGPGSPAGDYAFRIRVAPRGFPDAFAEVGGLVSIAGLPAFDARWSPPQARGRKEKFKLTLVNTGSVPLSMWMEGSDPEGMCKFQFPPAPNLEVGQEAVVPVWVGARRFGLIGPPETYDFQLRVMPTGAESTSAKSFSARFVHEPFLSHRFAFLSLFVALLGAIVGVAISLGTPKFEAFGTWVGCSLDSDYQRVPMSHVFIKDECTDLSIAQQCSAFRERGQPLREECVTAIAQPVATAEPTAVPRPAPECQATQTFQQGAAVLVLVSGGVPTHVRDGPGTDATSRARLQTNTPATIVEGRHECANGVAWWHLQLEGGVEGWVAERVPGNGEPLLQPQ